MKDNGAAARPLQALPSDGTATQLPDSAQEQLPDSGTARFALVRAEMAHYRPTRRGSIVVGGFLVCGLLLACAWWAIAPTVRDSSDPAESAIATDGTLLLLYVVAGIVAGAVLLVRPGPEPSRRLGEFLALEVLGAVTGWFLVDHFTEAGPLNALGVLLIWPLTTSLVVTLGTLRVLFSSR